jgi:hypothetical protein
MITPERSESSEQRSERTIEKLSQEEKERIRAIHEYLNDKAFKKKKEEQ